MPCIKTSTNIEITDEKEAIIKERLGQAITLIPGKNEDWLMLLFADRCRMAFRGNSAEPVVFIEVQVYGTSGARVYHTLTEQITLIVSEELGISPDHIYVSYQETPHWGWNGGNF